MNRPFEQILLKTTHQRKSPGHMAEGLSILFIYIGLYVPLPYFPKSPLSFLLTSSFRSSFTWFEIWDLRLFENSE